MPSTAPKRAPAAATSREGASLDRLLDRIDGLVDRLEGLLPTRVPPVEWDAGIAFRWRRRNGVGQLVPVPHPHLIALADLRDIDRQKGMIEQNTRQFVAGRPANNVLLTGARG